MQPIAVVIVAYNSAEVIGELLNSLPEALGGLPAEVVVVDNGSTDDTVPLLRGRGGCLVVEETNRGFSAGINRGVEALGGTGPILVLNPDVRMRPGSVAPLLAALELPDTAVAAPLVTDEHGVLTFSLRREPSLPRALGLGRLANPLFSEYVTEKAAYEEPHIVDWALGAALLVSRDAHERLGGWDESYFLYSEETDLCLRARDEGLATRFEPGAVVSHIGGASGRSRQTHAMQIVNRVRLYARRHRAPAGFAYLFLSVLSELTWLARGHRESATAIATLLVPSRRPRELGCSDHLLPR